jgi:hypothetical protein
LGTAPGATPARLIEHTMGGSNNRSQPELEVFCALAPTLGRSWSLGRGPATACRLSRRSHRPPGHGGRP